MRSIGTLMPLEWRPMFRRYARFCIVGGGGMVVDMTVLHLLASPAMLGWNLSVSKSIAAEVAIFNNFIWNELWTFRGLTGSADRLRQRLARLLKFNLICLAGIGWSVGLLNLQVHWLGLNVYLANFIAIVLVSLWNFLLNLRFGWHTPIIQGTRPAGSVRPPAQAGSGKGAEAEGPHHGD